MAEANASLRAHRQRDLAVVPRGTALPVVCIKCGRAATAYVGKTFHWASRWWYLLLLLLILPGLILLIVAMALFGRSMHLELPFCAEHYSYRQKLRRTAGVLLLVFLPLGMVVNRLANGLGFAVFIFVPLIAAALYDRGSRTLSAVHISQTEGRFAGGSEAFLQQLAVAPPMPVSLPAQIPAAPRWRRAAVPAVVVVGIVAFAYWFLFHPADVVQAKRNQVRPGMTAGEVFQHVDEFFECSVRTWPQEGQSFRIVHYGRIGWPGDSPNYYLRQGFDSGAGQAVAAGEVGAQVAQRTRDWNSDWRVGCTYITMSPAKYFFAIIFTRDGRVKEVSDVRSWD